MKKKNSKTIISLTDLREIQNIISPVPTKAEIRKSVDVEIKKLSDAKVANWKNTIKNSNIKKTCDYLYHYFIYTFLYIIIWLSRPYIFVIICRTTTS